VESPLLAQREIPRLAELRLQALGTRIDADLQLGSHTEVISELRQLGHARTHHAAALRLASQIGHKVQQARAHDGLGQACHAAGDLDAAGRHCGVWPGRDVLRLTEPLCRFGSRWPETYFVLDGVADAGRERTR
jgi:hypothetical protein